MEVETFTAVLGYSSFIPETPLSKLCDGLTHKRNAVFLKMNLEFIIWLLILYVTPIHQ